MDVVIVSTVYPFHSSDQCLIVDSLEAALRRLGHRVETFRIPFPEDWRRFPEQLSALRLIDIPGGDRMIAVRNPSQVIMHRSKVVWYTEHYTPAYDQLGAESGIPDDECGRSICETIRRADLVGMDSAHAVFASSAASSRQLRAYSDIDAPFLYPPLPNPEQFTNERAAGYLLTISDFRERGRQKLAVDAMRYVRTPVRLVLAGSVQSDMQWYIDGIRRQIEEHDLGGRVQLIDRKLALGERIELVGRSIAIVHTPWREISNVYSVLEAAAARKPVITAPDCGAAGELVNDESGWVADASPQALARSFDEAFEQRRMARDKGEALAQRVFDLNINWRSSIARLLA